MVTMSHVTLNFLIRTCLRWPWISWRRRIIASSIHLTGLVDLPGVEVIKERHHQALAEVDLHQGHGDILPALHRGHLLQHGQSAAVFHLATRHHKHFAGRYRWTGASVNHGDVADCFWPRRGRWPTPPGGGWGVGSTRTARSCPPPDAPSSAVLPVSR